jgi:zinc/manganese transport system substrate-binding protein
MKQHSKKIATICILVMMFVISACQTAPASEPTNSKKSIVVTYSILGSLVQELVGDQANVIVSMPNGQDPHEWEPSAKDMETLNHADLIVKNGLGLEGGMEKALAQAETAGVPIFVASDHITIRTVGAGEGIPNGDPDQTIGAQDPHLWTDPSAMKQVIDALTETLKSQLGLDVSAKATELDSQLDALDQEISSEVSSLPESQRKLVTGHESLGYFAERYGFSLVGAVIPSLSTQAETSASDMSTLVKLIQDSHVKAIFTEVGTPANVAESIGQETGVKVIEVSTHLLPENGDYFNFMRVLAKTIVDGLK